MDRKVSGMRPVAVLDEYELGAAVVSVATGVPGEPSDISQTDPSCSLVAGSLEEAWINEGFHEPDGMAISIVPVLGQASMLSARIRGSEIVYPHTWEDQETEVVGHKGEACAISKQRASRSIGLGVCSSRQLGLPTPAERPIVYVYRHVAERFTDEALKSEVVVFSCMSCAHRRLSESQMRRTCTPLTSSRAS